MSSSFACYLNSMPKPLLIWIKAYFTYRNLLFFSSISSAHTLISRTVIMNARGKKKKNKFISLDDILAMKWILFFFVVKKPPPPPPICTDIASQWNHKNFRIFFASIRFFLVLIAFRAFEWKSVVWQHAERCKRMGECDKAVATAFQIDLNVRILGFSKLIIYHFIASIEYLFFVCLVRACQIYVNWIVCCTVCVCFFTLSHSLTHSLSFFLSLCISFIHSFIHPGWHIHSAVVDALFWRYFCNVADISLFLLLTITILRIQFKVACQTEFDGTAQCYYMLLKFHFMHFMFQSNRLTHDTYFAQNGIHFSSLLCDACVIELLSIQFSFDRLNNEID